MVPRSPSAPPRERFTPPSSAHSDANNAGSDLDCCTSVAQIQLKSAEQIGLMDLDSSVKSSFHGSPEKVQMLVDLHRSDPEACHRLVEAVTSLPEVGTELLGFQLLAELGQGAFGRVYLARQGDLANRLVVLKVSPRIDEEPQTLAQLQHTNIVPVYSVHRAGPLQAVCMPYFGSTTLAGLLREIEGRKSLPESGKELVSSIVSKQQRSDVPRSASGLERLFANTVVIRKSTVRDKEAAAPPERSNSTPGEPASQEAVSAHGGTASIPQANLELLHKFSYVEAVLWIGSGLADGLAHAHERGIVHRDLKPANILLTDDGQPMLLDFNLAQDTKLANRVATVHAGGTLPFMAPEEIEAFRDETTLLDYRSDIYSLGVILYRLLTGRHPFRTHLGDMKGVLQRMLEDRLCPPPGVRGWNPAVSPAVESIVRHCLEPDRSRRYQSARELKEDIDRHLANLPLRHAPEPSLRERAGKWRRRHPRLASLTTVAVLATLTIATLLTVVVMRGARLAELEARDSLDAFLESKKSVQYLLTARSDDPVQIETGIQKGRASLASYGVLDKSNWPDRMALRHLSAVDQTRLRKNASELLVLLARGIALQAANQTDSALRQELLAEALRCNERAERCIGDEAGSRALWAQRAELTGLLGREEESKKYRKLAQATPLRTGADHYLVAAEQAAGGRFRAALPLLEKATAEDAQDFWAWFLRGVCHDHLGQPKDAISCYSTCLAIAPKSPWARLNRGLTYLRQNRFQESANDLDEVIALRPRLIEAYKNRAVALQGLKKYPEAIADLTRALELGAPATHVYFLRAVVRELAGDKDGANKDRLEGMRRPPTDEMGWLTRGYAHLNSNPKAALDALDEALKLNARSLPALQNKAHLLSKMDRNAEAVRALDKVVAGYPDFIPARAGRGVLLARLGRREAAHKDAVDCLARDNQPLTFYQLAGVYALTSKTHLDDRKQAFRLLSVALQKGCGFDLLETDRDLDSIRKCPEFQKLVQAARAIRSTTMAANGKR